MLLVDEYILGKGEFGIVYLGLAHVLPTVAKVPVKVALKTTIQSPDSPDFSLFTDELRIMTKAGRHVNIVSLLGVARTGAFR